MTATSSASNPVTASENSKLAVKAAVELIPDGTPLISTVGAVASHAAVALTADAGPALPAPSCAAPAATVTVTSTVPAGVTTRV